jgi:hypothetical protein
MNPVWPTPLEEQLLLAAFAPEEIAAGALRRCAQDVNDAADFAIALLPLVYRRWPDTDNPVVELGRRAYFTTWSRNRERMAQLEELASAFQRDGIRWMALKGAALALRHYADLGLRPMSDVDLLVHREDLSRAVFQLETAGYRAEEDATHDAILRQARVRHGWQFFGAPDWNVDLHWRPLNRCWSPEVARLFWEGAATVSFGGRDILVPSPSDQLFHVCVHGLQWDWTRKVRWVADALTILREPVDWERIRRIAMESQWSFRLGKALAFLRDRFHAPIPPDLPEPLCLAAPRWECREYRLLLKSCPLGPLDTVAWHAYNFRRIRPFDDRWCRRPLALGFPQYLATFLDVSGWQGLGQKLRPHAVLRLKRMTRAKVTTRAN